MGLFRRPTAEEMETGRPKLARTALKRARKFSRHAADDLARGRVGHYGSDSARAVNWFEIAHREIAKLAWSGMPVEEIVQQLKDPEYDAAKVREVIRSTTPD